MKDLQPICPWFITEYPEPPKDICPNCGEEVFASDWDRDYQEYDCPECGYVWGYDRWAHRPGV